MDTSLMILSVLLVLLLALIVGGYYFYQRLLDLVDALREHNLVQSDILDFYGAYYERQVAWREEDKEQQQKEYNEAFDRAAALASYTAERANALNQQAKRSHHKKSAPVTGVVSGVVTDTSLTITSVEQNAPTEVLTQESEN